MSELAQRTAVAEQKAKAAEAEGRDKLTATVAGARQSADDAAANLQLAADTTGEEMASWWNDVQATWSTRAQKLRDDVQAKKDEKDAHRAARRADRAESDAINAVAFALAAIDEAYYAVLDADLARLEADALAQ